MKYIKFGLTLVARGLWSRKAAVCVWCCVLRAAVFVRGHGDCAVAVVSGDLFRTFPAHSSTHKQKECDSALPRASEHCTRGPGPTTTKQPCCSLQPASRVTSYNS